MIIAGMATINGREMACMDAIRSIFGQVDLLFVYCEDKTTIEINQPNNVHFFNSAGWDERKFKFICSLSQETDERDYYFSLDDDLIYPPDYVSRTIKSFTDKPEILTYHGRTIGGPIDSYYRNQHLPRAQVLHTLERDINVNIPGTGCMAFRPKDFTLKASDFPAEFPLMADIHVGIAAQRQQIPIRALAHEFGWVKHSEHVDTTKTIFWRQRNADQLQVERCNSIEWKIYT